MMVKEQLLTPGTHPLSWRRAAPTAADSTTLSSKSCVRLWQDMPEVQETKPLCSEVSEQ